MGVANVHVIIIQAILFSLNSLPFGVGILLRDRILMPFLSCILLRFCKGVIACNSTLLDRVLRIADHITPLLILIIYSCLRVTSVHGDDAHDLAFERFAFVPLS